ncbi:MAG: hypothetical protein LBM67_02395 [Lentimicrobiaceae bacterium]|jgi:hypothetical protein|nr:hypothetical protein [Lentimicrobiaceae bacterium]
MKTPNKKVYMSNKDNSHDDFMHKPIKKDNKRGRKISIYDATDEDDDFVDAIDDVYDDFDLDAIEEDYY